MKTLKILTYLLIYLLSVGSTTKAATCDSTVWYENFNLLKLRGENRLPAQVKPAKYPFSEVCYDLGRPKTVQMHLTEQIGGTVNFGYRGSLVCSELRYKHGLYEYWALNFYPGDSIIAYVFRKRERPTATRWDLLSKEVIFQNQFTWTGLGIDENGKRFNINRLLADPQKILGLVPDTLGNEYYVTVRHFTNLPSTGYAIQTDAFNLECDPSTPLQRQRRLFQTKACYAIGDGLNCENYGPWLLMSARGDSILCDD